MESSALEAIGMEVVSEEVVMSMETEDATTSHQQIPPLQQEVAAGADLNVWMQEAHGIVERFKHRGGALPRFLDSNSFQSNPEHNQEHNDASKLNDWKQIVDNKTACPQEILNFLDSEMLHWREVSHIEESIDETHESRMREAQEIVQRFKHRGNVLPLPRQCKVASDSPDAVQEDKDATKLFEWKMEMEKKRSSLGSEKPSDEISLREYLDLCDYLDLELPGWRDNNQTWHTENPSLEVTVTTDSAMETARAIYSRYVSRGCQMPDQIRNARDMDKKQEAMDAVKLQEWKQYLLGGGARKNPHSLLQHQHHCPDDVCLFLDEHMPQWREKAEKQAASNQKAMAFAQGIVERYEARGNVMPVRSKECKSDPSRAQEYRDGAKLNDWKQSLRGNKTKTVCCEEVRVYLDEKVRREVQRRRGMIRGKEEQWQWQGSHHSSSL